MKKMAFVSMLVFAMAFSAEAARKGSTKKQPVDPRQASEPCAAYGCNDDDGNQSSDDTYVPSSGTFEGNDRDIGSDYINGMSY